MYGSTALTCSSEEDSNEQRIGAPTSLSSTAELFYSSSRTSVPEEEFAEDKKNKNKSIGIELRNVGR